MNGAASASRSPQDFCSKPFTAARAISSVVVHRARGEPHRAARAYQQSAPLRFAGSKSRGWYSSVLHRGTFEPVNSLAETNGWSARNSNRDPLRSLANNRRVSSVLPSTGERCVNAE